MRLVTKKGGQLSVKEMKRWNEIMCDAFGEDEPLNSKNRKGFNEDIFSIFYDKRGGFFL